MKTQVNADVQFKPACRIYSEFTVIKTEFNPSCIANFEMIAGVRVFELNFESNPAIVIAGQNVIISPVSGS